MNKYIKTKSKRFFTFDGDFMHSSVAEALGVYCDIESAAFFVVLNGEFKCFGGSTSLGVSALPDDAKEMQEFMESIS